MYFVGERPSDNKWRTCMSGEGEEVDEVIGWSQIGDVKVSYDDEDIADVRTPSPGVELPLPGDEILIHLSSRLGFKSLLAGHHPIGLRAPLKVHSRMKVHSQFSRTEGTHCIV